MSREFKTIKLGTTGFWSGGNLDTQQLDKMMNDLGRQGWEIVSAFDTNQLYGITREVVVIFKRQVA